MARQPYKVYAAVVRRRMSNASYARSNGLSKSAVTLYKRLGIGLVDVGIDPDSDLFRDLKANAMANHVAVATAIERPGATPEDMQRVLDRVKKLRQPSQSCGFHAPPYSLAMASDRPVRFLPPRR